MRGTGASPQTSGVEQDLQDVVRARAHRQSCITMTAIVAPILVIGMRTVATPLDITLTEEAQELEVIIVETLHRATLMYKPPYVRYRIESSSVIRCAVA